MRPRLSEWRPSPLPLPLPPMAEGLELADERSDATPTGPVTTPALPSSLLPRAAEPARGAARPSHPVVPLPVPDHDGLLEPTPWMRRLRAVVLVAAFAGLAWAVAQRFVAG